LLNSLNIFRSINIWSCIEEEIKRRLHSGNACYHSAQNILSSRLLSKNIKIRICRTIILLPVALYGCETGSLALRKEHRLTMFEYRVLRRILDPREMK
jgi:hypothetical protein